MSRSMIVVALAVVALALGAPGCAPPEEPAEEAELAEAGEMGEMPEDVAAPDAAETGDMAMQTTLAHETVAPSTPGQVNVHVTCPDAADKAVTVSVNPWTYERSIDKDTKAVWKLNTNSGNEYIEVRPVRPGSSMPSASAPAYPFMNDAPKSGTALLEVPKGEWKGQATYRYGYEIVVKCLEISPSTDYYEVVLDPEMEIRP